MLRCAFVALALASVPSVAAAETVGRARILHELVGSLVPARPGAALLVHPPLITPP